MFFSVLMLLVGLAVAGLTMLYVEYPRRGEDVPRALWLGPLLRRGVKALPTLTPPTR